MSDLTYVADAVCKQNGWSLQDRVGAGTFKETYRACTANGDMVAVKVFQPNNDLERIQRELDATRRCNHPCIGKITSAAVINVQGHSALYTVEEYLAGGTLTDVLNKGLLSQTDVYALGTHLISALAHIAGEGLVHRDLKPDNIMLRTGLQDPVIVDFGVVRDLGRESLTHTWIARGPGTPLYSPPEQLNNDKALIDWRSDQFSLGVVLAEALLGYHPYSELLDGPQATVGNVADRKGPSTRFKTATASIFPTLQQMLAPWPVGRVRAPDLLAMAWNR